MKQKFNFETGKVEKEYEVGDKVNTNEMGGLFLTELQNAKLDDIANQLWLLVVDTPPMFEETRKTLLAVLEYKLELIDNPENEND